MISIVQSDAVKWCEEYDGPLFHSLLCDPPYHLTSIVKRFGKEGSAPAQFGTDGAFSRASTGFMGKTWDGGDVAFRPETWAAFMKVLHPGAFGMAFASSRGWHRMAVAIEDAGFIIHPTIFGWLYGSGFPKATRIDTQIDRDEKADRKIVGTGSDGSGRRNRGNQEKGYRPNVYSSGDLKTFPITEPATDLAKAWAGHRYGGQALKPAVEPIIVFQKPYEGRPVDCMTATGAGALNIDAARIPVNPEVDDPRLGGNGDWSSDKMAKNVYEGGYVGERVGSSPLGRWPANFILDEGAAERLDAQSGHLKSGHMDQHIEGGEFNVYGKQYPRDVETIGDNGGASRFFFRVQDQIDESDPVYYCSKVSGAERNSGLTERCKHPTLKPISLAKYLSTLLLPPVMYAPRRIFVPFAGVASECIGAFQAGWEEIVGVEMESEYIEIARLRAEHWSKKGIQLSLMEE